MELLGRLLQLAVGSVQLTRPSEGSGHRLPNKAHAGKGVGLNAAVGQRFSVGSLQTNKFFAIAVGIVAQTQARGGGEKSKNAWVWSGICWMTSWKHSRAFAKAPA